MGTRRKYSEEFNPLAWGRVRTDRFPGGIFRAVSSHGGGA